MGQKAKPIKLHIANDNQSHLTKKEIKRRKKAEAKLTPKSDNIKRPKWLKYDTVAQREWRKIVPDLKRTGVLTNIDVGALAHCVKAYSRAVNLEKEIENEGTTIQYTNTKGETNTIENPKVNTAQKYFKRYEKLIREFGLTPSSRASLALNISEEEDKKVDDEFGDL